VRNGSPRLRDVAEQAGVSISTASLALSPGGRGPAVSADLSARIRQAAEALGYVPNYHARSMRTGQSFNLAVPLDTGGDGHLREMRVGLSFFSAIIGSIDAAASAHGYNTTIFGASPQKRALPKAIEALQQRRVDGIIVPAMLARDQVHHALDRKIDRPMVLLHWRDPTDVPVIEFDDLAAVGLAIDHLVELGHRQLRWFGKEQTSPEKTMQTRETVFLRTLIRRGLTGDSIEMTRAQSPAVSQGDEALIERAEQVMLDYLDGPARKPFTGIVCYNDRLAMGALAALAARGVRVPQDVSVVGIDNLDAMHAVPRLTTVSLQLPRVAVEATDLLLRMVETTGTSAEFRGFRKTIPPELVVRRSTAPPPKSLPPGTPRDLFGKGHGKS